MRLGLWLVAGLTWGVGCLVPLSAFWFILWGFMFLMIPPPEPQADASVKEQRRVGSPWRPLEAVLALRDNTTYEVYLVAWGQPIRGQAFFRSREAPELQWVRPRVLCLRCDREESYRSQDEWDLGGSRTYQIIHRPKEAPPQGATP